MLTWEPPDRLAFSWQIGPERVPEPNPAKASEVEVRFVDDGPAATRVELTHSRFDRHGEGGDGYRDAAKRDANLGMLRRCLEVAPLLGTTVVATETGTRHPGSDWTDVPENWRADAWTALDDAIATLLPVAERNGTVLALEANVKNVLKTPGQLIGLLERFPSPHLQVVCDRYNYISSHLIAAHERVVRDLLERFEHRFVLAHLKDVVVQEDGTTATPELGTGVFAQRPYLEFLRTRRPDLPLILEHLPLDHVPPAMRRVQDVLGAGAGA